MIDVNFITPEYKLKLFIYRMLQFTVLVMGLIIILEISGYLVVDKMAKAKIGQIAVTTSSIQKTRVNKAKLEKEKQEIPDLSNKIQILEDLFLQENMRFSEILYSLKESTPSKIWYTDMRLQEGRILVKGYASDRWIKIDNGRDKEPTLKIDIPAEIAILNLGRNLKDSKKFESVETGYIINQVVLGNNVKGFQMSMEVSPDSGGDSE